MALLESGINPIGRPRGGGQYPAILISSSPHRVGSEQTPWQDFFAPDVGHIRYFGDNKEVDVAPETTKGNSILLEQYRCHNSPELSDRQKACPIIFFKRVRIGARAKGNLQFQGFGVVSKVERVIQHDARKGLPFVNYVFDFTVLSLIDESENFDWSWINARRDATIPTEEAAKLAPASWKRWIANGPSALDACRRRVSKLNVVPTAEQRPPAGSAEDKALKQIYRFYETKKARFEALAAKVSRQILAGEGINFVPGWISPKSADGGADFVARLDIGSELAKAKLVVLGQAKCERLDAPTGGNHIARTVARLRRGWLGIYVTTSYFSEAVQREVIEDQYPIVLVDGYRLAKEVLKIVNARGHGGVEAFLEEIDGTYDELVQRRNAEEILME